MNTTDSFTVLDARTGKEISLAMEELWLKGKILPVGAHLLILHHFQSDEDRPLDRRTRRVSRKVTCPRWPNNIGMAWSI